MPESSNLQETIRENIERIKSVVQNCSTESVVGYSMVQHQRGFPELELSSPTKQIHLLLGMMLETEDPADPREFADRDWEKIVNPVETLGHAYRELYVPADEAIGTQSPHWSKTRQVAMTAFLDYHHKGLLASVEQVSNRILLYLTPFDDELSDTLGLSASEALNITLFISDQLQEQMDQLRQYTLNPTAADEYSHGLVGAVRRLGKISLADLVDRFGNAGQVFWSLFSIRRGEGPVIHYPTEQSVVESRPLIHITSDIAMLFNINILFSAVLLVGEETLAHTLAREPFRHRDKTLEDQTAKAFQRILGAQVEIYRNVFETLDNQYEHDLVAVTQEIVLFVESKASPPAEPFRDPDRAFVRIQRSFRSEVGIQKAYDQSLRLLKTASERELRLFDAEGKEVLCLPPSISDNAFCVCVTRDSFGPLATILSPLLSKGVDEPYPWVVNIFDLEHIAEAWEYFRWDGRQLKSFLRQRILLHENTFADDELDYVGAYIKHCGLHHFVRSDYDLVQLDPTYALVFDDIYHHTHHGLPRVAINPSYPWTTDLGESLKAGKPVSPDYSPHGPISTGRNELCPCGSSVKFKRCHGQ